MADGWQMVLVNTMVSLIHRRKCIKQLVSYGQVIEPYALVLLMYACSQKACAYSDAYAVIQS